MLRQANQEDFREDKLKEGKMPHQRAEREDKLLPNAQQLEGVIQQAIELLGRKLKPEQIREIAKVFQTLCWDFRDSALQICLSLDEGGRIKYVPNISGTPDATVTLDASTLHNSAYGKTTFGLAFVTGKLKVKGVPALKLTKFIPLLKPFLESYREAWEAYHE